jgi:hypothetical protein
MSYCRFGEADIYVFLDIGGYLNCCGCMLDSESSSAQAYTTDDMIAHLREHQAEGHDVPEDVIEALEADREENDRWIADVGDEDC